jgi:MOSC domain-containing protein YiiM
MRQARVESVNTGLPAPVPGLSTLSGIDKKPREGRVRVGRYGLAGDHVLDTEHHGGLEQAVYVYCIEDYDWWKAELGSDVWPGTFGENLTVSGLVTADVSVGDRFRCGDLVLEANSARIPCDTFAAHMGDKLFVRRFFKANRTGFYSRVIAEGDVGAGDVFDYIPFAGARVPITELVETYGLTGLDSETIARYRAAPVHHEIIEKLAARYG